MKHLSHALLLLMIIFLNTSLSAQTIQYNDEMGGYIFEDIDGIEYSNLVFEDAQYIDRKNWKVKFNDKYGLFGNDGFFNLNPVYDDVIRVKDSLIVVKIDSLVGIVDFDGNIIAKPIYDMIDHYNELIGPDNEYGTLVKYNGIWGHWENDQFIEDVNPIFIHPEVMPVPDFCQEEEKKISCINKMLFRSLKYPSAARELGQQGIVLIMFVVNKEGKTSPPKVIRSVAPVLDEEAMRVLSGLLEKWSPGLINDTPISTRYMLPVRFKLE